MQSRIAGVLVLLAALVTMSGCASGEERLSPPPSVPPLNSAAANQIYQQTLAEYVEHLRRSNPTIALPDVERVRYIAPQEFAEIFVDCLSSEGFRASVTDDNGIEFEPVPDEQAEAQDIALYVCRAKYPTDSKYLAELTPEQIDWLYDDARLRLIPCIEELGFSTDDLPSRGVFSETYESDRSWNPYARIPAEGVMEVGTACPAIPEEFWGE